MLTDQEIANQTTLFYVDCIAEGLESLFEDLEYYGKEKAYIPLDYTKAEGKRGKPVLVSAISLTPAGEGKTTYTLGLLDGLNRIGVRAAAALREPSLSPVFWIKGGATGEGRA